MKTKTTKKATYNVVISELGLEEHSQYYRAAELYSGRNTHTGRLIISRRFFLKRENFLTEEKVFEMISIDILRDYFSKNVKFRVEVISRSNDEIGFNINKKKVDQLLNKCTYRRQLKIEEMEILRNNLEKQLEGRL